MKQRRGYKCIHTYRRQPDAAARGFACVRTVVQGRVVRERLLHVGALYDAVSLRGTLLLPTGQREQQLLSLPVVSRIAIARMLRVFVPLSVRAPLQYLRRARTWPGRFVAVLASSTCLTPACTCGSGPGGKRAVVSHYVRAATAATTGAGVASPLAHMRFYVQCGNQDVCVPYIGA